MIKRTIPFLLAAALTFAACGSSDGGGSSTAATTGDATAVRTGGEEAGRLRACLSEHGVDLPERPRRVEGAAPPDGPPPRGARMAPLGADLSETDRERLETALEDCGGRPFTAARRAPAIDDAALGRYVACVRSNGYDLPDPDTSGDGPVFDADEVDRDDPAFVRASRACERLLAARATPPS